MRFNTKLIQDSFRKVKPSLKEVAVEFITELRLDSSNANYSPDRLVSVLQQVIDSLDRPQALQDKLQNLGSVHAKLGIQSDHYTQAAQVFLRQLRQCLAGEWNVQLEEQWILAIEYFVEKMMEGARISRFVASGKDLPHAMKSDHQDLAHYVRSVAREVLMRALEDEMGSEFMKTARKRATNILAQAIREEADLLQDNFSEQRHRNNSEPKAV